MNFPYDVAAEVLISLGGDMELIARRAADSFDYIFHFVQLKDKSQKRLKGIYEMHFDKITDKIVITQICAYNYQTDSWAWCNLISNDKAIAGIEENQESFNRFSNLLKSLSEENPMEMGEHSG
ncbi:hypothetical protein SDC9_189678 [bioreactor metagenome]|uniref:Uncharacterized protein n=1 Tax=bioreactor metagenome TaxID=1076179 RepID=A0A645HUH5_9ZZZZ